MCSGIDHHTNHCTPQPSGRFRVLLFSQLDHGKSITKAKTRPPVRKYSMNVFCAILKNVNNNMVVD